MFAAPGRLPLPANRFCGKLSGIRISPQSHDRPRSNYMKFVSAFLVLVCVAHAERLTSNIQYVNPATERQTLDVYSPEGATNLPVVFWIHGGGWVTGDKKNVDLKPQVLNEHGFVFVSTNYRLLP